MRHEACVTGSFFPCCVTIAIRRSEDSYSWGLWRLNTFFVQNTLSMVQLFLTLVIKWLQLQSYQSPKVTFYSDQMCSAAVSVSSYTLRWQNTVNCSLWSSSELITGLSMFFLSQIYCRDAHVLLSLVTLSEHSQCVAALGRGCVWCIFLKFSNTAFLFWGVVGCGMCCVCQLVGTKICHHEVNIVQGSTAVKHLFLCYQCMMLQEKTLSQD